MKKLIKYILLSIVVIIIYIVSSISPVLYTDIMNKSNNKYIIIGHRGAAGLAPENTLSSVKKGLEFNVKRIEIDVHQTKDNKVIVMHDKTLDRTTNGTGEIALYTYEELRKLDAGIWFSDVYKDEKIPLLEDVIKTINGKSELIIELKYGGNYYPNIEQNVINIIENLDATKWCIIHSFDTKILERVHEINPDIKLHKLFFGKLSFFPIIIDNGVEYYDFDKHLYISEYSLNYNFANKRIIKKIKKLGKKVNVWTVNDQIKFESLIGLGVDGIITDFPNRIK